MQQREASISDAVGASPDARREVRGSPVVIEALTKRYGKVMACDAISLDIVAGEFVALLGPSGSGKTTLLQAIAGFAQPDLGRILIGGEDMTRVPVNRRRLGMVFQKYTLFPHMSLRDNVAFPLKMRGVPKAERRRRADAALARVALDGYGDRVPAQVSGGQQQRVALARAIVYEPRVLLMDEPLGALDRNLREEMQIEIRRLQRELGITVIFVTHDQEEALTMADRVAVMDGGAIQQVADPETIYEAPSNLFVAGFVGDNNLLPVTLLGDAGSRHANFAGRRIDAGAADHVPPGPATLAVRPERIALGAADSGIPATLTGVVYSGQSVLAFTRLDDGTAVRLRLPAKAGLKGAGEGDVVSLSWPPEAVRLFAGHPKVAREGFG